MIALPGPDEFDCDVLAVDAALDALGRRRPVVADPVLSALASLAQAVDVRAAALEADALLPHPVHLNGKHASRDEVSLRRSAADEVKTALNGRHPRTRPVRKRLTRALLAVPVAAVAIVLAGMLPFNDSRGSPLYPLHQLIFHPDDIAAENAELYLASASQALDDATSKNGPTRQAGLEQARRDLAEARTQLAQIADSRTRAELERQLSNLEQRATQLANDDDDRGDGSDDGSQGQDEGNGDGANATPEPTDDPANERDQPEANPDSKP